MGAASARAADHWAPAAELVVPAPDTHLALRLATNSRNGQLLKHADQNGPRDGAGAVMPAGRGLMSAHPGSPVAVSKCISCLMPRNPLPTTGIVALYSPRRQGDLRGAGQRGGCAGAAAPSVCGPAARPGQPAVQAGPGQRCRLGGCVPPGGRGRGMNSTMMPAPCGRSSTCPSTHTGECSVTACVRCVASTPLQVIRYTDFMGRDMMGLLAMQEARCGTPVPPPGPPARSALVRLGDLMGWGAPGQITRQRHSRKTNHMHCWGGISSPGLLRCRPGEAWQQRRQPSAAPPTCTRPPHAPWLPCARQSQRWL